MNYKIKTIILLLSFLSINTYASDNTNTNFTELENAEENLSSGTMLQTSRKSRCEEFSQSLSKQVKNACEKIQNIELPECKWLKENQLALTSLGLLALQLTVHNTQPVDYIDQTLTYHTGGFIAKNFKNKNKLAVFVFAMAFAFTSLYLIDPALDHLSDHHLNTGWDMLSCWVAFWTIFNSFEYTH